MNDYYTRWCAEHGCTHAHCPSGCAKPQPFHLCDPLVGDRLLCGRCWFVDGCLTDVVPCVPEVCD
jgi:hypothetical protein